MLPLVARPGTAETLALGGSSVTFLAPAELTDGRFSLTDSVLAPGFPGPVPHRHKRMVDAFLILEGTVTFRLGAETRTLGAGSFAMAPPGVVHTFANPGPEPARLLNLMVPGGLEGYLREVAALGGPPDPAQMAAIAARYDFLPASGPPWAAGETALPAVVVPPGGGERIALGESSMTLLADGAASGGDVAVGLVQVAPGYAGPPPHRHMRTTEAFYLLEGAPNLRLEDGWHMIEPGTFAMVAPGTVHTMTNGPEGPARAVNLFVPAGLEGLTREVAARGWPPDPATMAVISARYDVVPAEA
jgi:uncharacterized cupin superfamily protein